MENRKGLITVDTNYLIGNYNIKRDLLYFDTLTYDKEELKLSQYAVEPIAKVFLNDPNYKSIINSKISDLEFLEEKGLVESFSSRELEQTAKKNNIPGFKEYFERNQGSAFFSETETMTLGSIFFSSLMNIKGPSSHPFSIYKNNFVASLVKAVTGNDITPICFDKEINNNEVEGNSYKVLQIVLNKMPMPNDNISLEQIIDLKSDKELKGKFLALRNWMIDISKANYSANEMEEKFDYLYNEYKNSMDHHKIETTSSSFKSIIITTTEVLENIIKLKWSTALKTTFELFDSETKLASLEMNTIGRELAYIYEINNRLKQ